MGVEALRETVERQRRAIAGLTAQVEELRQVSRGWRQGETQEEGSTALHVRSPSISCRT